MQPQPTPDPATLLRDIAPPVDVFPYPVWMVVVAVLLALILVGLLFWAIMKWWKRQNPVPPLLPHERALQQLAEARTQAPTADPPAFGALVSDILRSYVGKRYGLPATRQTSPEFLTAAAHSPLFSDETRESLAAFLEQTDLLKFARLASSPTENLALCDAAEQVIRSGQPAAPVPTA